MAPSDAVNLTGTVYDHYYQKQIIAAGYVCISVLGVVGNLTVLLSGLLSLQPRTKTNVFVFNMALADLVASSFYSVNAVVMLGIPSSERPPVPQSLCALTGYLIVVTIGCSINNIACVAVYRALITVGGRRPLLMSLFTPKGLVAMVCTSWLIPMAMALIPILTEYGAFAYDVRINTCTFNPTAKESAFFSKITVAVFYPTQLVVTFASYAAIFIKVRKHLRTIKRCATGPIMTSSHGADANDDPNSRSRDRNQYGTSGHPLATINPPPHPPAPSPTAPAPPAPLPSNNSLSRRSLTVTMNMLFVLICFIACITPYSLLTAIRSSTTEILLPFFGVLVYLSSGLNPVIYMTRHPDFKEVSYCILSCKFAEIPKKSAFLRRLLAVNDGSSGD